MSARKELKLLYCGTRLQNWNYNYLKTEPKTTTEMIKVKKLTITDIEFISETEILQLRSQSLTSRSIYITLPVTTD